MNSGNEITTMAEFEGLDKHIQSLFLGGQLLGLKLDISGTVEIPQFGVFQDISSYSGWLYSPEGTDSIKRAMIERGREVIICFSHDTKMWSCLFPPQQDDPDASACSLLIATYFEIRAEKPTEEEAVIHAAAKAFLEGK